jgi:hypothetical protein
VDLFLNHYGWETSAFLVGVGYGYKEHDFSFQESLLADATQKIKLNTAIKQTT